MKCTPNVGDNFWGTLFFCQKSICLKYKSRICVILLEEMKKTTDFSIEKYHALLCPEFPEFLKKYLDLKILTRLKGIGLLCGTDWTPLFHNQFYYSRFDHSTGCALIAWNFTHSKKQAIAALLHDVSTPVFSHVSDFRKGDALTQTATEDENASMIHNDAELQECLKQDGLTASDVDDYHRYPVCDNEVPCLSADRLEYMYPSGAALDCTWNMESVSRTYRDIMVLKNENGDDELGFRSISCAKEYFTRFMETGLFLQTNTDKMAMSLLGEVLNLALKAQLITEENLYTLSEQEIISLFDKTSESFSENKSDEHRVDLEKFLLHYKAYRTMTQVTGSDVPLEGYYSVSVKVKKRYINPLVMTEQGAKRICDVDAECEEIRKKFFAFEDTKYACVKL